ncbi:MAG: hypothetical protein VKJ24_15515 [Synechococcales bacterium]|nr:hypothetical protein [Synechococcales bacterium]
MAMNKEPYPCVMVKALYDPWVNLVSYLYLIWKLDLSQILVADCPDKIQEMGVSTEEWIDLVKELLLFADPMSFDTAVPVLNDRGEIIDHETIHPRIEKLLYPHFAHEFAASMSRSVNFIYSGHFKVSGEGVDPNKQAYIVVHPKYGLTCALDGHAIIGVPAIEWD